MSVRRREEIAAFAMLAEMLDPSSAKIAVVSVCAPAAAGKTNAAAMSDNDLCIVSL